MYSEFILVFTLLCFSVYCDIRYKKIHNSIIFIAFLAALIKLFIFDYSIFRILDICAGFLIPIFTLFPLFYIRSMGAGDIKLLSIIGFITGFNSSYHIIIYSLFAGAIYAVVTIILQKNFLKRLKSLFRYINYCVNSGEIASYSNFVSYNGRQLYFSVAIMLGYLAYTFIKI